MKKSIKLILLSVLSLALLLPMLLFSACDKQESVEAPKSALRGTFTYQNVVGSVEEGKHLTLSADPNTTTALYSQIPTFNQGCDWKDGVKIDALFKYDINQRLKLSSDFTYTYSYSVLISNPQTWGSDIGKMEAYVVGTFTYEELGDGKYAVNISNPTGGTFKIYGIDAHYETYYWWWRMHEEADYVQNFDYSDCFSDYDYTFVGARKITVNKKDRSVDDNMFNPYLFNEMTKYGTNYAD